MRDERNPVDRVRQAWLDLDIPEPGGALEDSDPSTQATVKWLQGAWSSLPVPEVQPPARAAMLLRSRWRRVPLLRRFQPIQVAAAALLLVSAVVTYQFVNNAPIQKRSEDVAVLPERPVFDQPIAHRSLPAVPITDPVKTEMARLFLRSAAPAASLPTPLEGPHVRLVYLPLQIFRNQMRGQFGPQDHQLMQIVRLNRAGSWSQASELAQRILAVDSISKAQKCETLCQMALSLRCLGQVDESEACLAKIEEELRP